MFEGIGDMVETDLVHVGSKRIEKNVTISPQTQDVLLELADKVGWALSASIKAVERDDKALAVKVIEAKDKINSIADDISGRLVQRLVAEDPHRTSTFRVESQLIENYKRIYYFTKRIAKMVAVAETAKGGPQEFVPDAL